MLPTRRSVATTLLTLALTGPVAVAAVPSAGAAVPQCQGQDATIVKEVTYPPEPLIGTEGDDVIIAKNTSYLQALGGDDVICADSTSVDAGAGDDDVEISGLTVTAVLGPGADQLVSVAGEEDGYLDQVWTGTRGSDYEDSENEAVDTDPDRVDLRVGFADGFHGRVNTGQDDRALDDVIIVRGGWIYFRGAGATPSARLEGDDRTILRRRAPGDTAHWSISLGARTATSDGGQQFAWSGMGQIVWFDSGSVVVTGTPGDDSVYGPIVGASLGAGDDHASLSRPANADPDGVIDGGPGSDSLNYSFHADDAATIAVDVPSRSGRFRSTDGSVMATAFSRFEGYEASSSAQVRLRGGPAGESLRGQACDLAISGGGGTDRIVNERYVGGAEFPPDFYCDEARALLSGGYGDDRIQSSYGEDEDGRPDGIQGGGGNDRIIVLSSGVRVLGGPGNDWIRVERTPSSLPGVNAAGGPGNDTLKGHHGRDIMSGGDGRDVINGGLDRDSANGGPDVDRCLLVERRTSCERR